MIWETYIMPFGIMEIAVVYSSKDEELWLELARSYLKWQIINEGYDSKIKEATEPINEIDKRLDTADIVLLLVSEHFINSDYCWGTELLQVMERHEGRETYWLMLKGVGRVGGGANDNWIRLEEICNFPYTDLCTIDQLWVKYSNGHFGFSVQKCIWQEKQPEDSYRCEQLFQQIGWLNTGENCQNSGYWKYYNDLTFSLEAPQGHLPALRYWGWFSGGCGWVAMAPGLLRTLLSRL